MIIRCRVCGGEGFIEHGHPNAPDADWVEPCEQCASDGCEVVTGEPINEYDLAEFCYAHNITPKELIRWLIRVQAELVAARRALSVLAAARQPQGSGE